MTEHDIPLAKVVRQVQMDEGLIKYKKSLDKVMVHKDARDFQKPVSMSTVSCKGAENLTVVALCNSLPPR